MTRSFNHADLFEIVADAAGDRVAVVSGDARLTFRELEERANRLAHHLIAAGTEPGDRVAILSYNRVEWLEAQIGAYKVRAVPINVNYRYTADELAYVIADSEAAVLVGERSLIARLGRARDGLKHLRHVIVIEDGSDDGVPDSTRYEEALAAASPDRDFPGRSSDDLYILYTGGTTGKPKGVMWRQEDVFFGAMGGGNMLGDPITDPGELAGKAAAGGPPIMVCAPLMHGAGMWVAWVALTSGAPLVLWTEHNFDADRVLRIAAKERAAMLVVVGDAMARPLADQLPKGQYDLSGLLAIVTGGSITSPDVKQRLQEGIPSLLTILDAMGGSETGAPAQGVEPGPDGAPRFRIKPEVAVLGADLMPVEPGSDTIGVFAKTGRIPLGYWNDEAKTAATFVTGPDGRRWALQGDMARLDSDGFMVLLGRGSLVINTGGEKVFVEEVEIALKSHPDVYDALVVGIPDERFVSRVAAVVSPVPGRTVDVDALREHCRATLAGFKVPREIFSVDEVRRTPSGKADYRWAREVAAG
jgi:fatty-acyl-CoA synthase